MKEYNNVIFFKSKSEADKMYNYITDYVSRSYMFTDINDGYILDTNISYEENKYYLIYHLEDFKKIKIGESKKFYLPTWAKLKIYSKGLINGYGEPINSFESELSGYYLFKKIDNKKRAVLLGNIKINDYETLLQLEDLIDLYDAESIVIKSTTHKSNKLYIRNNSFSLIFKLLQRPKYSKYRISIELNINQLASFFSRDYAFLKSSSWDERKFILDLEPTEILISSKYKNYSDSFYNSHNIIDLEDWEKAIQYIESESSLNKYIKRYDKENHEIYLYYGEGKPKFKIKLLIKRGK